ncbi:proline and serine-rich protein 3 [Alligator mississippiensis]|uniref:Proline and serine-rich protein 3 n=1 Tax=Alligator mississippiensis TaxID=8496 RepID=A0A151P4S6_ALLMI|nr:proline and serine-rich protein 3 [Alligator mississippiensis]
MSAGGSGLEESGRLGCTEPRGASQALDAPPLDSPEGSDNPETRSLQERAAQLLLRSASSLGSSEGLSPHPTSSPRTSKPDTAAGFLCSGFLIDGPGNEVASEFGASRASPFTLGCLSASHIPQSSSLRPEDDILFQWRLRRKMEVASEGTSGVWRTPGVPLWRGDTAWLGLRAASSSRDSGPQAPQQGVIAERLLSPPLGQEESVGPLGQEEQPVAPLGQESFPPGQEPAPHTQLLGLAARLLQEAEDSDGTEFEADPLLQVLRGQREVLRRCLRAVDLKVMQLEGGGSPEHDGSPC